MHDLRGDVRRVRSARRERVEASPARVVLPLLTAIVVIGSSAAISAAAGLSSKWVALVSVAVALVGAAVEHRSVSSVVSGVVLLLARPYEPGERLRVSLPGLGLVDAEVVRIGLANTTLCTSTGLLRVPNSRLLRGAPNEPAADLTL